MNFIVSRGNQDKENNMNLQDKIDRAYPRFYDYEVNTYQNSMGHFFYKNTADSGVYTYFRLL
jgi:hypothetical protein